MSTKLDLKIYDRMKSFFEADYRFKILVKGRQVGATTSCANYLLKECLSYKNRDYLWVDTTLSNIKLYYESKFLPKLKLLPTSIWSYNKSTLVLKVNGNRIVFGSYEAGEERLEGGTYDLIIVNECGFLLKERFLWERTLLPMLLVRRGRAIFVGTPKSGKRSFHYELVSKIQNKELDNTIWYVDKITIDDTPFVSKEDKLVLYNSLSEESRITEYYGNFRETSTHAFARSFNIDKHVKPVPYDTRYVGLSFDFNVGKMSCLVFGFNKMSIGIHNRSFANEKVIKIYKEFNTSNFDTIKDFCIFVKDYLYEQGLRCVLITGDATGNSRNITSEKTAYQIISLILNIPFSMIVTRKKNFEHSISGEICNLMLSNYQVEIDTNCVGLIEELCTIEYIIGTDKLDKSNPEKGHILDCFRYILDNFCLNNSLKFKS